MKAIVIGLLLLALGGCMIVPVGGPGYHHDRGYYGHPHYAPHPYYPPPRGYY